MGYLQIGLLQDGETKWWPAYRDLTLQPFSPDPVDLGQLLPVPFPEMGTRPKPTKGIDVLRIVLAVDAPMMFVHVQFAQPPLIPMYPYPTGAQYQLLEGG